MAMISIDCFLLMAGIKIEFWEATRGKSIAETWLVEFKRLPPDDN